MSRKLLTYSKDGERVRVLWTDGKCNTPEALEKVLVGDYTWENIKTSGTTWTPPQKMRFITKKLNANDHRFLGLQNPPKVAPKEPVLDSEGKIVAPRKKRATISPETIETIKKLAEEGKTLKQTEAELGIPYAKLNALGKEHGITFVKGKKGRQASGIVKALNPELIVKVKALCEAGKTVSQTVKELLVPWFEIVKIAKQENLTFVKGKRGRQKKVVDNSVNL